MDFLSVLKIALEIMEIISLHVSKILKCTSDYFSENHNF